MVTRVVTAHIPADLAKKVDQLAERMDRPRGWIVKEALTALVQLEDMRHARTLEALEDVAEGRVVSHAHVEVWAKKAPRK